MKAKFGGSNISMREAIITSILKQTLKEFLLGFYYFFMVFMTLLFSLYIIVAFLPFKYEPRDHSFINLTYVSLSGGKIC